MSKIQPPPATEDILVQLDPCVLQMTGLAVCMVYPSPVHSVTNTKESAVAIDPDTGPPPPTLHTHRMYMVPEHSQDRGQYMNTLYHMVRNESVKPGTVKSWKYTV